MAIRRSARSTKQKTVYDDDAYEEKSEEDIYEEPVRKRAKKTTEPSNKKNIRGKRGLLSQLTEFPLDVLFEIFGCLAPYDLLRLARTTKLLRSLLFNRSNCNAYVWKDARATIEGLPEKPDDLSEPAFANLCFYPFCHNCDAPNIKTPFWALYTRLCQACISQGDIIMHSSSVMVSFSSTLILPSAMVKRQQRRHRYTEEAYYSIDMVHQYEFEYQQIKDKSAELREWIEVKSQRRTVLDEFEDEASEWLSGVRDDRAGQLDQMRRDRQDAVLERLRDLGWGDTLDRIQHDCGGSYIRHHPIKGHKSVNKTQKLTDRTWPKLSLELVPILQERQRDYAERDRIKEITRRCETAVNVVRKYRDMFAFDALIPRVGDYLTIPPLSSIVFDTDIEQTVDEKSFSMVVDSFSKFEKEWLKTANADLLELLPPSTTGHTVDELHLAKNIFQCSCSRSPLMWYPHIIAHNCSSSYGDLQSYSETERRLVQSAASSSPWKANKYRYMIKPSKVMEDIMELLGLNPDTTTYHEIEQSLCLVELTSRTQPSWDNRKMFATPVDALMYYQAAEESHTPFLQRIMDIWLRSEIETHEEGM